MTVRPKRTGPRPKRDTVPAPSAGGDDLGPQLPTERGRPEQYRRLSSRSESGRSGVPFFAAVEMSPGRPAAKSAVLPCEPSTGCRQAHVWFRTQRFHAHHGLALCLGGAMNLHTSIIGRAASEEKRLSHRLHRLYRFRPGGPEKYRTGEPQKAQKAQKGMRGSSSPFAISVPLVAIPLSLMHMPT